MRALVQRVAKARVRVGGRITGEIGHGLLLFVGVANDDTEKDVDYIAAKVPGLRVISLRLYCISTNLRRKLLRLIIVFSSMSITTFPYDIGDPSP